ncbi:MAG TPA: PEP/pyruvate-binding domain-containing protein, partial [Candidatus Saccharimonadales bacterium]|nr:PEP/pyruvate-binding domain-containing protein [Candidatus Saccharimonadales bacterium]
MTRARKPVRASRTPARKSAGRKWVYRFTGGKAEGSATMRSLLGGKGAGLAEMTNAGLPVPPGFTITTAACNAYFDSKRTLPPGLWAQVEAGLSAVEHATGKRLGDATDPLL